MTTTGSRTVPTIIYELVMASKAYRPQANSEILLVYYCRPKSKANKTSWITCFGTEHARQTVPLSAGCDLGQGLLQ